LSLIIQKLLDYFTKKVATIFEKDLPT